MAETKESGGAATKKGGSPKAKSSGSKAKSGGARGRRASAAEKVAQGYFDAVTRRDPDGMAEHWAADGIEDIVPVGIMRGPEEVRAFFREMFAAVPDTDFTVTRMTPSGDVVAVEWRMSGTFSGGPFQGIEPNGRRLELRGVDLVEVEDGKIVRNTAYYDGMAFARSVGMLPAQDSAGERAMKSGFNAVTRARAALRNLSER